MCPAETTSLEDKVQVHRIVEPGDRSTPRRPRGAQEMRRESQGTACVLKNRREICFALKKGGPHRGGKDRQTGSDETSDWKLGETGGPGTKI